MAKNNSAYKLTFILGAIAGAAAALMLTPASGKKIRRIAVKKGKNLIEDAKEKLSDFEEEYVEENVEKMRDNIDLTLESMKEKGEKISGLVKDKTEEAKEEFNKQILNFRSKINSGKLDN